MSFHFLSSAEWKSRDSASARFGLQAKRAAESIDAGQLLHRAALVISKCAALGAIAAVACCADSINARTLRVCADPNNLPFSNEAQQGFENRLAEIIAAGLGATLKYTWWAERASFLRNSLDSNRCDAVMGIPATMETLNVTAPYYRSTYVIVTRHDRRLHIESLLDPALDDCRIGVHVTGNDYAPPAAILARRGLSANIVAFSLFGSDGEQNPPSKLIDAVRSGDVDVAIVWGPFAGYFARRGDPALDIYPVSPTSYLGTPFTYEISIAVRKGDSGLRDEINQVLQRHRESIRSLLNEYGVPLVDEERP
jgi:quinoprotein dehydrogenase-associated probable ABC transporter substrate-binding protein